MNVPSVPIDKLLDERGEVSEIWLQFFQQLLQLMQQNLSDEGFLIPQQPTNHIVQLTDASKTPDGTILYNTSTNEFQGKKAGTFRNFLTT